MPPKPKQVKALVDKLAGKSIRVGDKVSVGGASVTVIKGIVKMPMGDMIVTNTNDMVAAKKVKKV